MPNRTLVFVAAPLVAAPIAVAFLFVGGAAEPPGGATVSESPSHSEPRGPTCGSHVDMCPQGVALRARPLEC